MVDEIAEDGTEYDRCENSRCSALVPCESDDTHCSHCRLEQRVLAGDVDLVEDADEHELDTETGALRLVFYPDPIFDDNTVSGRIGEFHVDLVFEFGFEQALHRKQQDLDAFREVGTSLLQDWGSRR